MSADGLAAKINMIAAAIKHEDDLIGQRTTWLVTSQSFLFGAFVALVNGLRSAGPAAGLAHLLLVVIPLIGVLMPAMVLAAVAAASYTILEWRAELDRLRETPEATALDWPQLKRPKWVLLVGQLLPFAVGLAFTVSWIAILIRMAGR